MPKVTRHEWVTAGWTLLGGALALALIVSIHVWRCWRWDKRHHPERRWHF